jgi:hypothetical protein
VLRPQDARDRYRNAPSEFARLVRNGELALVAHGYYVAVPEEHRGVSWRPAIEGLALGVAVADYGRDSVALMGISAARVLGAVPRALASAVIAVPRQRPGLATTWGHLTFVKRSFATLDTQRVDTEITRGWVTSREQTVLDLADRPVLGGVTVATAQEAIRWLLPRSDMERIAALGRAQRKLAAWQRVAWLGNVEIEPSRRDVSTLGFSGANPERFGLVGDQA